MVPCSTLQPPGSLAFACITFHGYAKLIFGDERLGVEFTGVRCLDRPFLCLDLTEDVTLRCRRLSVSLQSKSRRTFDVSHFYESCFQPEIGRVISMHA